MLRHRIIEHAFLIVQSAVLPSDAGGFRGELAIVVHIEGHRPEDRLPPPKGAALRPVLEAMRDWGLKWEKGTRAKAGPGGAS